MRFGGWSIVRGRVWLRRRRCRRWGFVGRLCGSNGVRRGRAAGRCWRLARLAHGEPIEEHGRGFEPKIQIARVHGDVMEDGDGVGKRLVGRDGLDRRGRRGWSGVHACRVRWECRVASGLAWMCARWAHAGSPCGKKSARAWRCAEVVMGWWGGGMVAE